MPIINTLETARKLEAAGFPEKQATVLTEVLESTAQANQQDLKAFISEQARSLDLSIKTSIAGLESKLVRELRSQLYWVFTLVVAMMAATVALIKLLP